MSNPDALLIGRIRQGEAEAWNELIARFEGRLLAFAESRLGRRSMSEDVVQEAFIGFLTSLPNYDLSRPLEGYLFSIAAHKLTDAMRREGRRPALPLSAGSTGEGSWDVPGRARGASSMMRSGERRQLEEVALAQCIGDQIARWKEKGGWQKIQCCELLFVRGWANQDVADHLGISEQTVANIKFDFLARLRKTIREQNLSEDVFPELYEQTA